MSKIGFSASLRSGNLDKLPDQLNKCKELSIDSVEIPIYQICLLYTSPSPRDATLSRMPSSA